ncbi:uncharacterized protein LOC119877499 [Canis lupus familiaris]|uniref:uncharacterized protein LOC119877499 n=1 Tax=Canis lupus familiaris TaxID=9615 RepID=UPI0018F7A6F6|nr:uncharacterized protein LOC119877499 [Canis lupus familiaris]
MPGTPAVLLLRDGHGLRRCRSPELTWKEGVRRQWGQRRPPLGRRPVTHPWPPSALRRLPCVRRAGQRVGRLGVAACAQSPRPGARGTRSCQVCGRGRRRPAGPTDVPSLDREFAVSLFWVAAAVTVGGSGSAGEAGAFGGRAFRGQPHRDFRGLVVLMKPVTKKPVAAQRRAGRPPPAGLVHLLRKGVAQLLACPRGHGVDRRPGHSASGCRAPPSQWGSPGIPPLDRLGAGEGKPACVVWACACAPPAAGLLGGHPTAGVGVHARRVKEVPGASWGCRQLEEFTSLHSFKNKVFKKPKVCGVCKQIIDSHGILCRAFRCIRDRSGVKTKCLPCQFRA